MEPTYAFDAELDDRRERLAMVEELEDPATFRLLEHVVDVGLGWNCLEVGAGAGSVARWLRERIGARGAVTVIDLDTRLLEPLSAMGVNVRQQDLSRAELEVGAFDLVHGRNVLAHIPERESLLLRMVEAVRGGGFILVEEPDLSADAPDPGAPLEQRELYIRVTRAIFAFLREQGLDPEFGGRLTGLLQRAAVDIVVAEGRARVFQGGQLRLRSPHVAAFVQLRPRLTADGVVSEADFEAFLVLTADRTFFWREAMTIAVCGRRPE